MKTRTDAHARRSNSGDFPSGSYDAPNELNDSWFDRAAATRRTPPQPQRTRPVVIDPLADDWFR